MTPEPPSTPPRDREGWERMRQRLRELEGRVGHLEGEKGELERENTLIKALLPPLSPAAQALMSLAAGGTPGGFPGTGRAVQTPPAVRTPARPRVAWADEEGGELVDEIEAPEEEPPSEPEAAHFEPFPELEPEPEPEPEPEKKVPAPAPKGNILDVKIFV